MDDFELYRRRQRQRQQALRRLGVMNVRCLCGETDPTCFEADHIGRRALDGTVWGRCANCHRKITARQSSEHPGVGLHPGDPFVRMGHAMLGMYEYLSFIADRLRAMAGVMFKLAGKGIDFED